MILVCKGRQCKTLRESFAEVMEKVDSIAANINEQIGQCRTQSEDLEKCFEIGTENLQLQQYLVEKIQEMMNRTKPLDHLEREVRIKIRQEMRKTVQPELRATFRKMKNEFQKHTETFQDYKNETKMTNENILSDMRKLCGRDVG